MTLKTLIRAAVVAGALTVAGVASAATPLTFDSKGVALFGNSFASSTLFVDDYSFDVSLPGDASATAIAGFTKWSFNAIFSQAFIYAAGDVTKTHLADSPFSVPNPSPLVGLTATLGKGSYVLELVGYAADGGSYGGTLSVPAVPEPETYAMFLAGLGVMGAIVRRRKNG